MHRGALLHTISGQHCAETGLQHHHKALQGSAIVVRERNWVADHGQGAEVGRALGLFSVVLRAQEDSPSLFMCIICSGATYEMPKGHGLARNVDGSRRAVGGHACGIWDAHCGLVSVLCAAFSRSFIRRHGLHGEGVGTHSFWAVAGGICSGGKMCISQGKKLSINAVEGVSAAAEIFLIETEGGIPLSRQLSMKCDINTACAVVNHSVESNEVIQVSSKIWRLFNKRLKLVVLRIRYKTATIRFLARKQG